MTEGTAPTRLARNPPGPLERPRGIPPVMQADWLKITPSIKRRGRRFNCFKSNGAQRRAFDQ